LGPPVLPGTVLSDEDGRTAVGIARAALARAYGEESRAPSPGAGPFAERHGVFVTLRTHPSLDLRGCIGFPLPVLRLDRAIAEAAVAAARDDPRFPPVSPAELRRLVVEVSVLTPPEPIPTDDPEATVRAVRVGRDGLIVEGRGASGLLLPQVAPEQGWDARQLLDGTCEKAGLPPHSWQDPRVRIRRFQAEVFSETAPGGAVVRAELTPGSREPRPAH
jgi:uncharacterized protein